MTDTVHVKGLDQLAQFLGDLPGKLANNVVRGGARAGCVPIRDAARSNIHQVSGALAKSLGISSRIRGDVVTASVRSKVFYATMVEHGTRPHTITAKNRKAISFGGLFFKSVEHPGAKPHPFMRPALDTQAQAAVVAMGEYIKARLATKEGLDTSDVEITAGGDL